MACDWDSRCLIPSLVVSAIKYLASFKELRGFASRIAPSRKQAARFVKLVGQHSQVIGCFKQPRGLSLSECDVSRVAELLEHVLFLVNQIGNENLNEVVVDLLDQFAT